MWRGWWPLHREGDLRTAWRPGMEELAKGETMVKKPAWGCSANTAGAPGWASNGLGVKLWLC